MKTFDDLQNIWDQQPEPGSVLSAADMIQKAETNIRKVKNNHKWTIAIISVTSLILAAYYIWIGNYNLNAFSLGLGIMIAMLLLRIFLEYISIEKFNRIKPDSNLMEYSQQAQQFYGWRKKIHFVLTPVIYISYVVGFIILLPVFKENLSHGLFLYILISGFGFLIGFVFVMMKKIKQELQLLEFLKNIS